MKHWLRRWGPAFLVMGIIFAASATPGSDLPTLGTWDLIAKKGGHMAGYALLAIAYLHALGGGRTMTRFQFLSAFFLACLYAGFDEFHQSFTPGRSPSILDAFIDAIGAALGLAARYWILRRRNAGAIRY